MLPALRRLCSGQRDSRGSALNLLMIALSGCVTQPPASSLYLPATVRSVVGNASVVDGRAHFREIFCAQLLSQPPLGGDTNCADWLWKLPGEPAPVAAKTMPRELDHRLRVVIVGGAFGDCYPDASRAFADLSNKLKAASYYVEAIPISGRSSSKSNAQQIRDALPDLPKDGDGPLVLVGYSKGAMDILQMLAEPPGAPTAIAAVIAIAGSVNGSPLADRYAHLYDRLLAKHSIARCSEGDSGVVDSLRTTTRLAWWSHRSLPSSIRYYSLGSFTTPDRLPRSLLYPYKRLARIDARNDGQLLAQDQMIPGSTLLGYVNADHWAIAIHIEDALPFWAHRSQGAHQFPQNALLESALLYVQQDLLPSAPD